MGRQIDKSTGVTDAITLLDADHDRVDAIFKEYERIKDGASDDEKLTLVKTACAELSVHAQVEEEIFYPALRKELDELDVMNEADVEHSSLKQLISALDVMEPSNQHFDATFKVLAEYVKHHVKEERQTMFPKARKTSLDMDALGERIRRRSQELKVDMSLEDDIVPLQAGQGNGRSTAQRQA